MIVATSDSELFLIEPAVLKEQFLHFQVAPEIIGPFQDCAFEVLNSKFESTTQRFPKPVVVAYVVAPPALIVDLIHEPRPPWRNSRLFPA